MEISSVAEAQEQASDRSQQLRDGDLRQMTWCVRAGRSFAIESATYNPASTKLFIRPRNMIAKIIEAEVQPEEFSVHRDNGQPAKVAVNINRNGTPYERIWLYKEQPTK